MKEDQSLLLPFLGESPEMKVIDFLMENYLFGYTRKEIVEGAGIFRTAIYKVIPPLVEKGVVVETSRVGKARFYKINRKNAIVKKLYAIDFKLIEVHANLIESKQKILDKISA